MSNSYFINGILLEVIVYMVTEMLFFTTVKATTFSTSNDDRAVSVTTFLLIYLISLKLHSINTMHINRGMSNQKHSQTWAFCHFDEFFVIGCTKNWYFDNFRWSQTVVVLVVVQPMKKVSSEWHFRLIVTAKFCSTHGKMWFHVVFTKACLAPWYSVTIHYVRY